MPQQYSQHKGNGCFEVHRDGWQRRLHHITMGDYRIGSRQIFIQQCLLRHSIGGEKRPVDARRFVLYHRF